MKNKIKKNIGVSSFEKYNENPFIEKAIEKIEENKISKRRFVKGNRGVEQSIVNREGEVTGHTAFLQYIEVDEDKFAKLYLSQFSAFWDLSNSAMRVFSYFLTQLRPNNDMLIFNIEEALEHTKYKSKQPIYNGLVSLLENEIIARGWSDNVYFINPMCVFNGNRVTFAESYIKKKKPEIDENQTVINWENENKKLEENYKNQQDERKKE